jgi:hypothetical protein
MLRKTSAAEPVLGVIGTFCIEPPEVAPVDPPPEALIPVPGTFPSPPLIGGAPFGGGVKVTWEPPPVCPIPTRESFFNPLTGRTEYYFYYPPGVTVIPPECNNLAGGIFN